MINPAIIVVGYNRPDSVSRLLNTLLNAIYPEQNITLIISLDNCGNNEVLDRVSNFSWPFGDLILRHHEKRLGLRKHILECGRLSKEYGSVIILEDDLVVSPYFYKFACDALTFYKDDQNVGGISLYKHQKNVNVKLPFTSISDKYDVYWHQFASSWGQAWTESQWDSFENWLENNPSISTSDFLPDFVISWPETSWLKYFIKYLTKTDKYFIYPKVSLTSNYSDVGTHVPKAIFDYQVNLELGEKDYKFSTLDKASAVYDVFFELSPLKLKAYNTKLNSFDFEVDLYGSKPLKKVRKKYLLTSKDINKEPIYGFSRFMKPHDLNIIYDNTLNDYKSDQFAFDLTENFSENESSSSKYSKFSYSFGDLHVRDLFLELKRQARQIVKRYFKS